MLEFGSVDLLWEKEVGKIQYDTKFHFRLLASTPPILQLVSLVLSDIEIKWYCTTQF